MWQLVLASYLGVAVWANDIGIRSSTIHQGDGGQETRRTNRFAAFYVLAAYLLAIGMWLSRAETRSINAFQQKRKSIIAAVAQSSKEAPPMVALPQTEPLPVDQVLIMDSIEGWKPYDSGSKQEDGRTASSEEAAAPSHILYFVRYSQPNWTSGFYVEIRQYPNSDWARYELRNTPMRNERFNQSKQIQLVSEFGSRFYEETMYRYWSSGDKLIFLDGEGILPADIEKILKAYLNKYPSSIQ